MLDVLDRGEPRMDSKTKTKVPDPRPRLRLVKSQDAAGLDIDLEKSGETPLGEKTGGGRPARSQLARELSSFADALDREIAAILNS